MEYTTYNKYTQVIPTSKEVADYFILNGLTAEQGLYWFGWMDRKEWKDSSGKKIIEWSKIAWLRIQDLKNKTELNKIVIGKSLMSTPKKKTAEQIISENLGLLFKQQTGKSPDVIIKLIEGLVLAYKTKYSIKDDLELVQSIQTALEECIDWEFESIKTYLK